MPTASRAKRPLLHTHESTPHDTEVKTLLSWEAPQRRFVKRDKSFFTTSLLLTLVVEILLFLFSQYMLMLVILSLVFVAFALATTPPRDVHYRISTEGVFVENHFFLWKELYDFYFTAQKEYPLLHIGTVSMYPGEIILALGDNDMEHVKRMLLPYLPFREYVNPTFVDKAGDWIKDNFPLESHPHRLHKTK